MEKTCNLYGEVGVKAREIQDYKFVDLQFDQDEAGQMGDTFIITKAYSSIAEMKADFGNMELGDYVIIASSVEFEDKAKLYTKGQTKWIFITDLVVQQV